jgi:Transposase
MWFAGIDWADRHHDTVVIDEAGRKVAQLRVGHNPEGLKKLVSFLHEIAPLDQIACILETNHGLLITALLEAGLALYPVNPKTIDRKRTAVFRENRSD